MEDVAAARRRGPARWWVFGAVGILAVAAIFVVILASGGSADVKTYTIVNSAMAPSVRAGQTVTADLRDRRPGLGRVIVFYAPTGAMAAQPPCRNPREGTGHAQACDQIGGAKSSAIFIKRVVGLPGDRISLVNGEVIRNGSPERIIRVAPCTGAGCSFPQPITIPQNEYFVLGDNRGASDDSRFWGPVPRAWIIGTVVQ